MSKVPQNHRHASLANNLRGSALKRVNSLILCHSELVSESHLSLKQYTPLKFASPAIIARSSYRRIIKLIIKDKNNSTFNGANN